VCPAQSARIRCRTSQDDGRRASQTNDRIGGKGCADTASVQAKDPQGAENEGNSEQCHSRQTECEAHAVHSSANPSIDTSPQTRCRASSPLVNHVFSIRQMLTPLERRAYTCDHVFSSSTR
jgi:hypothetical protein